MPMSTFSAMLFCPKRITCSIHPGTTVSIQYIRREHAPISSHNMQDYLSRPHTITIPPLQCTPPLRLHPSLHRVCKDSDSWMLSTATALLPNPVSESTRDLLVQSQFWLLAAAVFADSPNEQSCTWAAMYIAWICLLDDMTDDRRFGRKRSAAEALVHVLEDILLGHGRQASLRLDASTFRSRINADAASSSCNIGLSDAVASVALDWWTSEFRPATITPSLAARLFGSFYVSIQAAKDQISAREAFIVPDTSTYILRRRDATAVLSFFMLLECCLGIELDEETLESEVMRELHAAVVDHMAWANDLLSLQGEYAQGDLQNIATVLCMNEYPGDLQASVEEVSRMIAGRDEDVVRAMEEVRKCKWLMGKPGMEAYLQGLANWLPANIHWAYTSARYHGVGKLPFDSHAPLTVHLQPPLAVTSKQHIQLPAL